jgi:hypothetical protein
LRPVITNSVCHNSSLICLVSCDNRAWEALTCTVLCLCIFVPGDIGPIRAIAVECPILLVETEAIYGVYDDSFVVRLLLSVALETELLLLTFIFEGIIEGLHAAPTLNRPDTETLAVREAINSCCSVLQRRLDHICWVKLVALEALLEIPNM